MKLKTKLYRVLYVKHEWGFNPADFYMPSYRSQSALPVPLPSLRALLILSSHLFPGLRSSSFSLRCRGKVLFSLHLSHMRHLPCLILLPLCGSNNILWREWKPSLRHSCINSILISSWGLQRLWLLNKRVMSIGGMILNGENWELKTCPSAILTNVYVTGSGEAQATRPCKCCGQKKLSVVKWA